MRPLLRSWCIRLVGVAVAVALVLPAALGAQIGMSNGLNYTGDIGAAGEVDLFNFTATAGEDLIISIGETGGNTAFFPWIRLLRPDGTQLGSSFGALVGQISVVAPATGTYTVQVASGDSGQNDTGSYTLTLAKSPGAFTIALGDEGGALANGENHTGAIHFGDLDMWSFSATSGDALMVSIGETGVDTAFFPWIRLRGPGGEDLGSSFGTLVGQISATAPATGTYTVVVSSGDSGLDGAGTYTLTLAKAGSFTISDGDEGGALANGSNQTGDIHIGDLDMWSFTATAGDDIIVAAGETGGNTAFSPWIRLRGPSGQDLGSSFGALVGQISTTATVTGPYTVVVGTGDSGLDGAGAYTLTLARSQAAFTISPGDQGGALTNGSNHTGDIHIGDLDMWSFTASAGDSIVVSAGETGSDTAFFPWLRLRGPTGQDLGSSFGGLVGQVAIAAPASGTYTVVVGSGDSGLDANGSYTLTLAKGPGAFTISPGDQGGAMTNGENHTGDIHIGDLDMWSFTAAAGEALTVSIGETGPDTAYTPWIRLRSPTGQDLGNSFGGRAGQINTNATVSGTYTVIVSTGDSGLDAAGPYTLTIANTPRPFTVPVTDQGGPIVVGDPNPGSVHTGDVDMWTFHAHDNDALTVIITDINSPGTDFTPWIRLRTPTGVLLSSSFGATTATIVTTATETGTYTVLVSSADSGLDGFGDYELTVSGPSDSMIKNGNFSLAEANWQFFATPTMAYIQHQVTNGVLQYYRVPPPEGTTNQAVAFQETGVSIAEGAPVEAQFDLANTSSVRKRISVLILDFDFSDLSVCTFWLEANAPMRTYRMRTFAREAWVNTALYFYAASAGENGGRYEIDNVAMRHVPGQAADRTDCVDPTAPAPPGGAPGPELLVNGNFDTGTLTPWFAFGTITSQITNGVFQFIKPSSAEPAGVVAQPTGQAMPVGQILTATFKLGNSSSVRKRVTVIMHDQDFSDLSACTFWLTPFQPLSTYEYRAFATKPWANAMLSIYPATIGLAQWIQLDDVTFRPTPGTPVVGAECIEPGGESEAPIAAGPAPGVPGATASPAIGAARRPIEGGISVAVPAVSQDPASSIVVSALRYLVPPSDRTLEIQVSSEGGEWVTLLAVDPSEDWRVVALDVSEFRGAQLRFRIVQP